MKTSGIPTLTDSQKRCAAMPQGGIGTGSIAIGADGLLKQWQIMNNVRHIAFIPNSFFGIRLQNLQQGAEAAISRALICAKNFDRTDVTPAECSNDHFIGLGARAMLATLPQVEEIQFHGEYPYAFLKYLDKQLPVEISATFFNPFIPHEPKNSGLPIIFFDFRIENNSPHPFEVALMGSMLNFVGWNGIDAFLGNECKGFGGNSNHRIEIGKWSGLFMQNPHIEATDYRSGDLTFAVNAENPMIASQWDNLHELWENFSQKGTLAATKSEGSSPLSKTWAGSIGTQFTVGPGEKTTVRFLLGWNFPNREIDWLSLRGQNFDPHSRFWVGNMYNNWFSTSLDAVKYTIENYGELVKKTELFHDNFYESTLPPPIMTSISAPLSTLRSPTCFWIKDGSFHGYEGCHGAPTFFASGGSCPLDCTHVWNYATSHVYLFPSLERSLRKSDFKLQQESGLLHHRLVIPDYLPQLEYDWERLPPALDGMLGMILKIYRDYCLTGDLDFLTSTWDLIENLMGFILTHKDKEHKGIILESQPNTYDCILYGINTFIGSLYLAALRAGQEIARVLKKTEWHDKFQQLFRSGQQILDAQCWNGEYYIQIKETHQNQLFQYDTGCHSDQLNGQWWAFELGFGYILPKDHVDQAIESIVKYNFKDPLGEIPQYRNFASPFESGLLNCTWPRGGKPPVPIVYHNEVWTGIEYEVASLCFRIGKDTLGRKLIDAVRQRYDGTRRNPWNEIEWGDHYVRPLSSWTLLTAISGYHYYAPEKVLTIQPRKNVPNSKYFFITGSAWGRLDQIQTEEDSLQVTIHISHGNLELSSIKLTKIGDLHEDPKMVAEPKVLPSEIPGIIGEEQLLFNFHDEIRLEAGQERIFHFKF